MNLKQDLHQGIEMGHGRCSLGNGNDSDVANGIHRQTGMNIMKSGRGEEDSRKKGGNENNRKGKREG